MRLSLVDWCGLIVFGLALVLPARPLRVERPFSEQDDKIRKVRAVARAQAEYEARPQDVAAMEGAADALRKLERHDVAFRTAGGFGARGGDDAWKGLLEVSTTHADRVELDAAFEWAGKSLAACDKDPKACPEHERLRLLVFHKGLRVGLRSGIDPRIDPEGFRREVLKAMPRATFRN